MRRGLIFPDARYAILSAICAVLAMGSVVLAYWLPEGSVFFGISGALFFLLALLVALLILPVTRRLLRLLAGYAVSDPALVPLILVPRDRLQKSVTDLLIAYHQLTTFDSKRRAAIVQQVQCEIIERLTRPLREDYRIEVRVSEIADGFVRVVRKTSFVLHRPSGDSPALFGERGFVFTSSVEYTREMQEKGISPSEVSSFRNFVVGGVLQDNGSYGIARTQSKGNVRIVVSSAAHFPSQAAKVAVEYVTESVNRADDYMTLTMTSIVLSAWVEVSYDPEQISLRLLKLFPAQCEIEAEPVETIPGVIKLDLKDEILVPLQTLVITWNSRNKA